MLRLSNIRSNSVYPLSAITPFLMSRSLNLLLYSSIYQIVNVTSTNGKVSGKDWQEPRLGCGQSDTNLTTVTVLNSANVTKTHLFPFIISLPTMFCDLFIKFLSSHYLE